MVTLTIFHPYLKKTCQIEREFAKPINIKDYTKGLQSRVSKFLDALIQRSIANEASTYSTHSTANNIKKLKKPSF
jgi:hypothetical protein